MRPVAPVAAECPPGFGHLVIHVAGEKLAWAWGQVLCPRASCRHAGLAVGLRRLFGELNFKQRDFED
ncbi:hypothetical protein GRJ2_002031200 [Grus japonensis]|uniref:Uncharacterized protein n=1 Tax=Grus japonensis TaxID=30415 RepID=A0ABC9XDA3_GRUJA